MATDEWLLWQLADSAFPVGGLAHSNGLEAALQNGIVSDAPTLEAFVMTGARQTTRGVLNFVRATRRMPNDFETVDARCDLFLNNHVTNRASRAQGRAFLAAASRIFATEAATQLSSHVRTLNSPAHLAPVFGLVSGSLGLSEPQTESLFVFIFVRGCLGSAVRLGIVGPLEAQRIQSRVRCAPIKTNGPPVQTSPVLDLLQATQDRLYSRLFQS